MIDQFSFFCGLDVRGALCQRVQYIFDKKIEHQGMLQPQVQGPRNLLEFKLDFSLIQDALSSTIQDIYSRLSTIEGHNEKLTKFQSSTEKQISKLYQLIETNNESHKTSIEDLQQFLGIPKISGADGSTKKNPKQLLDQMEKRVSEARNSVKGGDTNVAPGNTSQDRIMQAIRLRQSQNGPKTEQDMIDMKVYTVYEKTIEKMEEEITKLRKEFRNQISQLSMKSKKIIESLESANADLENSKKERKALMGTLKNIEDKMKPGDSFNSENRLKDPSAGISNLYANQGDEDSPCSPLQKLEIKEFLDQLKKEVKAELEGVVKNAENKFEQVNRTNSVLADHLVQAKKSTEELINYKDSQNMEMTSIREKNSTTQRQICLLVDSSNQFRGKIKSLQANLSKLIEEFKQTNNQTIKELANEDQGASGNNSSASSRKDLMRDSHGSFRASGMSNLNPLRNNSLLKVTTNKLETMDESMKNVNSKLNLLVERLNRIEDDRKKWDSQQFNSTLPKLDKENKSNINPMEIVKRQIKRLNEDLLKTNQKLTQTKQNLQQLYETHKDIPQKIYEIHEKLREKSELEEDRLIELIKQLINRMLSDPFDNNFTNRLKRQINVKFLEIKHEYNCILKEIESKVENRAEIGELTKISNKFEEGLLETKAICNKKCDTQDFKKGIKYLENKIKQVFQFARTQTVALANEQKQYIGAKKQQLH